MPIDKSSIIAAAPPAKAKVASAAAPKAAVKTSAREEAVNGLGQIGQVALIAIGQHADAGTIGTHWPNVSRETAKLAETHESIAALVDKLLVVGPYTALIAAVMPMGMQFAVNHGWAKAGTMGTVSREHIESRVKTQIAQLELAMLREQQEAEQEAAAMRAALADAMRDQQTESTRGK